MTAADVVVVGAGFAGLAAARELTKQGYDVVVLEGRDRVGGRSYTGTVSGLPLDLGGTFVGPTQDAVLALAAELGCPTTPTFHHGRNLINWRGKVRSYSGTIPSLSLPSLLNIGRIRWQFARVARGISVSEPWTSTRATELDAITLEDWLRSKRASSSTLDLMAIMARVTWGAEPSQVSMLHALRYVKAAGGLDRMLDVTGGAQQDRFAAGTQQIAVKMAEQLKVVLGATVSAIDHDDTGVRVTSTAGTIAARAVIVAILTAGYMLPWAIAAVRHSRSIMRRVAIRSRNSASEAWLTREPLFITPLKGSRDKLDALYERLSSGTGKELKHEIIVFDRKIRAIRHSPGAIWFDFMEICGGPRAQTDYLEIAREYQTVFVSNVPKLAPHQSSEARRFTWLVDVLYDRRVKLIVSAEVPPEQLYTEGPLSHEFPRTVSRLNEMQSAEFLALEHRTVDTQLT